MNNELHKVNIVDGWGIMQVSLTLCLLTCLLLAWWLGVCRTDAEGEE